MNTKQLLEDELVTMDEIMDVIAGNVEVSDLREFRKAGVKVGHA